MSTTHRPTRIESGLYTVAGGKFKIEHYRRLGHDDTKYGQWFVTEEIGPRSLLIDATDTLREAVCLVNRIIAEASGWNAA